MAEKEDIKPPINDVPSAPHLPHDVAKEYGLHREGVHPTEPEATTDTGTATDEAPEDAETAAAVDDIVAKESDALLDAQDGKLMPPEPVQRKGFWAKVKRGLVHWWRNKPLRWTTIIILVVGLGTLAAVPKTRYFALNTMGVRSTASVIVLDDTTQLPLKNVTVRLGSHKAETDRKGVARLQDLKLGDYTLTVERLAFAREKQNVTIGLGSNPLGKVQLRAVGVQYVLQVSDYLSGKPIEGAEVISDELNALSDKTGKATLTLERTDNIKLAVAVSAPGYRLEAVELDAAQATRAPLQLVPAQKAVYVSRPAGTYDVFTTDLDGKNTKRLLPGSGLETANISLVVSPDNSQAALVSTRDSMRTPDGYLLYALTIINLEQGTSVTVDHAERIQLVGWSGPRLVYRTTVSGASAANSQRNRLISYNFATNARLQLATANQFNALLGVGNSVYYGVSSSDPSATLGLFRIKADGSGRERLIDKEIWTGVRDSYDTLKLQAPDGWYTYNLESRQLTKSAAPADFVNYVMTDDSKGRRSIWAATQDGKGVLVMRDASSGKTRTVAAQSGLTYPVYWAGDKAVIYRSVTAGEAADYVVSPDGGAARKLADVVPVYGYTQVY